VEERNLLGNSFPAQYYFTNFWMDKTDVINAVLLCKTLTVFMCKYNSAPVQRPELYKNRVMYGTKILAITIEISYIEA
jgi:hypothetical protein